MARRNSAHRLAFRFAALQEGVSENQFREMTEAGVQLVVPKNLHQKYPEAIQPHLQEFESFLGAVRALDY